MAIAGKKVILIDCDFRRPKVHKVLQIARETGIVEYLAAKEQSPLPLSDLVIRDKETSLDLLLGHRNAFTATDSLVTSERTAQLLEMARGSYDYVILDTSPVLAVTDPRLLLRYADAVLFIVEWAATPQRQARAALKDLSRLSDDKLRLAVVLNKANIDPEGYGYSYRSPYGSEV
jgi:Mrp family chromosome partitioning ATPase